MISLANTLPALASCMWIATGAAHLRFGRQFIYKYLILFILCFNQLPNRHFF